MALGGEFDCSREEFELLKSQNQVLQQEYKLQIQENEAEADQLLTDKMQAAASIIKNQKLEYAEALKDLSEKETEIMNLRNLLSTKQTDKVSLDQSTFDSLSKLLPDIQIPLELEESSLFVLSNLLYQFDGIQNQIQEQNHYLKVTSEGFNYEREVLEKDIAEKMQENQELKMERKSLRQEIDNLQGMMTQIKVGVAEKLKQEFDEKEKLGESVKRLLIKEKEYLEKVSKLQESLQGKSEYETLSQELEGSIKQNEKLSREIERLRHHLVEVEANHSQDIISLEDKISSLKAEISEASREQVTWAESVQEEKKSKKKLESSIQELQNEIKRLNNDNELLRSKAKEDSQIIDNLQMVLNEFQSARDTEIKLSLTRLQESLLHSESQCQKFEERALSAETQLSKYESEILDSKNLSNILSEKESEILKLKHDIANLQSHLSEAMRRLKTGINSDIVDKKLVSNLFVQFLSLPRGESRKFEILDVISGILNLSDSDKMKIGLLHDKKEASPGESTSFTDMWISFLYKEAGMFQEP